MSGTTITVTVTGMGSPVPADRPPTTSVPQSQLPFTGFAADLLLAAGLGLLVLGAAVVVAVRRREWRTLMARRATLAVAAMVVAAAAAAPALADSASTTVTVATGSSTPGSRQLELLDLAGRPLTNLPLTAGQAKGFRVRVTDTNIGDLTTGFTVDAVMSSLYRASGNGFDWANSIPASDASIGYASNPFSALGLSYHATPGLSLSGLVPNCTTLVGLVSGVTLTALTNSGICSVVGAATGGVTLPAINVPTPIDALVSGAVRAPYDLTGHETGAFSHPDFANGIGAQAASHDPANDGAAATPRTVMVGTFTGLTNLLSDISGAVTDATNGLPFVSATGTGALASLSDVLNALSNSGQSALSNALASLTADQAIAILNNLVTSNDLVASVLAPVVGQLSDESGTYNAFPNLTVRPTGPVSTGTYQGTLTVTMVQP